MAIKKDIKRPSAAQAAAGMDQLQSAIESGLSKKRIEALLERKLTDNESAFYHKARAAYCQQLQKRRAERKYKHNAVFDRVAECRDKQASIDDQMAEAMAKVDVERKARAKTSVQEFIKAYLIGSLFEYEPEAKMCEALDTMHKALMEARPYNIELPRGSGKTSAAEAMLLYLLSYGFRKFLVIVSNSTRNASQILKDLYRVISERDSAYAQDFPEVSLPFILSNGATRRRQIINNHVVGIQYNAQNIVFPRIEDENGVELPTSQNVVTVRGISSGIRGLKSGKLRPDAVICDDLQDAEIASNPTQVDKLMQLLNKDVMNLSSGKKLAVLMTSTPICCEDLCERIEKDVSWKTTKYKALLKWPKDIEEHGDTGLWGKYFQMYDTENMLDKDHSESLQFYSDHFEEMNEGAETFSTRYRREDGHISNLQALLEKRHLIGEEAFMSEMQMTPQKFTFAVDISAKDVVQRIGSFRKAIVPDGFAFVCASTDLNVSYALTTSVVAFKPDNSSVVLAYKTFKSSIDLKLNDTEYNKQVYQHLQKVGKWLKALGMSISAWGIDAGGRNWDTVCEFAKNSAALCGIPACAMAGRASHVFNPNVRTRLRDSLNRTVLCGDPQEHARSGSGQKYMFFDSDFYREKFQKAMLSPLGSIGSCQLHAGTASYHQEFATQTTNERLKMVKKMPDGRHIYYWTTKEPHDYLDTMAMCFAIAGSQGISGQASIGASLPKQSALQKLAALRRMRPRVKFV